MAPSRPAVRRERNNDYSAVGTAGRRTGVTLAQGRLDENGLEEITGLFSSPTAAATTTTAASIDGVGQGQDDDENKEREINASTLLEASEDMKGMDSSGLTPTQALSVRKSLGAPALRPRSASPRKSGISGSARRSNGLNIASPSKTVEREDEENGENSSPTPTVARPRRSLPSPQKLPLKEVVSNGPAISPERGTFPGVEGSASGLVSTKVKRPGDAVVTEDFTTNPMGDEDEGEVDEVLSILNTSTIQDGSPHPPFPQNTPKAGVAADNEPLQLAEPREQQQPPPSSQPLIMQQKKKNGKKRKSDDVEVSAPVAKKSRAAKAPIMKAKEKLKLGPSVGQEFLQKPALSAQEPAAATTSLARFPGLAKDPNTHLSQRQQAELDQIIEKVKARPGKLKSLYVLKREKSKKAGPDDVRSGRAVVKPLAYWSTEQCVHNDGTVDLDVGSRIPLGSVQEIAPRHKDKEVDTSNNDNNDDDDEEDWEKETGVYRGQARIWSQADQQSLPADQTEENVLAYHPSSILTSAVNSSGSGFRYAKLISMPFFGSGVVDLPVGGVKRPKSSNSMQMVFFVFKGRVTVRIGLQIEVGDCERFSVGKGGVFQVPRGNRYSIENVLEKPARLFFSQGCETVS